MSDLRKLGALWKKDGKKGTFYSGTIDPEAMREAIAAGETRLLLFKVQQKRERGPDMELFAAPDARPRREDTGQPYVDPPVEDDSIPF